MKKIILLVPILAALSACSSVFNPAGEGDFACPGMPKGVICKTPAAVYGSTNGEIPKTEFDTPIDGTAAAREASATGPRIGGGSVDPMMAGTTAVQSPSVARPLREAAQVMRIWYAPWIDKNDGFNGASYKFVEVVTRKWSYGRPESIMGGVVAPYKGEVPANSPNPSNPVTEVKRLTSPTMNSNLPPPQAPPTAIQPAGQRNNARQTLPNGVPSFNFQPQGGAFAPTSNPFN